MSEIKKLMKKIDYQFHNIDLLELALTHRSYGGNENNERLEFLGDSIVNFVIASDLYERFPEAKEGQLSRVRSHLVKGDTLAELAKEFGFGRAIKLGSGELKSGGAERISILADVVEAIIGAVYLDIGMEVCYQKIIAWYQERLNNLSLDMVFKDPKSLLQELVQGRQLPLPEYKLIEVKGGEHEQRFVIACSIKLLKYDVVGEGTSRRRAEQDSAQHVLEELERGK